MADPEALVEFDQRIAIVRDNLRELVEQAAAYSGAADEARNADRIADQEAKLAALLKERAALGEWRFRQEYFCEFVEGDDQVFLHDAIARAITKQVSPLFTAYKETEPCLT